MSPPEPCTVQVLLFSDSLPDRLGLPISAQVQPDGQLAIGVGLGVGVDVGVAWVMLTLLKVAVPNDAECEVIARPASIVPLTLSVADDPEMVFQLIPSEEVAAVKVLPTLITCRYTGEPPLICAFICALAP